MSEENQDNKGKFNEFTDGVSDFVENFKDDIKDKYNRNIKDKYNEKYKDKIEGLKMPVNKYTSLMYISQFLNFFFPFAGIICPLIMWSSKKNKDLFIHSHGKNIFNWMISSTLYIFSFFILLLVISTLFTLPDFLSQMIIIFGILFFIIVVFCSFIFTIIGAAKAFNKKSYQFPITISFIK